MRRIQSERGHVDVERHGRSIHPFKLVPKADERIANVRLLFARFSRRFLHRHLAIAIHRSD